MINLSDEQLMEMISERTANYETVKDFYECKTGKTQDFQRMVTMLVSMWDNALTIEEKDNICKSEVTNQFTTSTTLNVVYKLQFPKMNVTVLKVFMSEFYEPESNQDNISIVDEISLIIGIELKDIK